MYVTVRRFEMVRGSTDELWQQVEEEFVPIISQVPGFIAYYTLDSGDGVVASISIFEDQAGAEESDRQAAEWVKENVASLFDEPPEITAGEAMVHKTR